MKNLYKRMCRQCGSEFLGGPRAWYCLKCRKERERERRRKYNRSGFQRKIGSLDICVRCGKEYIVKCGAQKYCSNCAPIVHAEQDRIQGMEWYHNHSKEINPIRNESRRKKVQICVICGEEFPCDGTRRNACSTECRKKQKQAWQKRADAKRRK